FSSAMANTPRCLETNNRHPNITQAWLTVCSLFDTAMQFPFCRHAGLDRGPIQAPCIPTNTHLCSLHSGEDLCEVVRFLGRTGGVPLKCQTMGTRGRLQFC